MLMDHPGDLASNKHQALLRILCLFNMDGLSKFTFENFAEVFRELGDPLFEFAAVLEQQTAFSKTNFQCLKARMEGHPSMSILSSTYLPL